ncbi:MAG: hypothetical protein CME70_08900 [Halobacteriovorax sp.]|nr:hypothetical protein [Halobacteriovorax sp.]|tara:strand:- start:65481 stop:66572 length:1092 start_codon:yes stop_codon:yes gene_type:complete
MIKLLFIGLLIFTSCKKEEDFNPYLSKGTKVAEVKTPKYLYKLDGNEVGGDEIPIELRIKKYNQDLKHYYKYYNAVESYAVRMNLKKERGMNDVVSGRDLAPTLTEIYENDISDKDVEEYVKKNESRFSDPKATKEQKAAAAKYELLIEHITPIYLKKRKQLYESDKLHVNILPPDIRKTGIFFGGYPKLGKPENKLELLVITNYLCKDCREYNEQITKLYEKYGDKLTYIHAYHAFRPGSTSHDTILAGHCINLIDKKKYWFYHKKMYEDPIIGELTTQDRKKFKGILNSYLSELKMDEKRVFTCMADKENERIINDKILEFGDAGIKVLPMFYLNGRQLILLEKEGLEAAFKNMAKTLGLD